MTEEPDSDARRFMRVKPAHEGGVVRYPQDPRRRLSESGARVPRNSFWMRRLRSGDVVECKPEPEGEGGKTRTRSSKPKSKTEAN